MNHPTTSLLQILPATIREKLLVAGHIKKYAHGQLIHTRGEDKPGLSIVHRGAAQVGINGTDGVFVPVALLGVGESFGEFTIFTNLPRTHDVSAVGSTEIVQISQRAFTKLHADEPEIANAMLQVSLIRNHQLLEMLDALRRLPILERTASMLLSMSATSGTPSEIYLKQADLAYALGISRVSLGKALRKLSRLNLIKLGYGRIEFSSRRKLVDWVAQHCNTTPLYWG